MPSTRPAPAYLAPPRPRRSAGPVSDVPPRPPLSRPAPPRAQAYPKSLDCRANSAAEMDEWIKVLMQPLEELSRH